jgi:ATP-binding cassette subfamily C protein LapB
MSTGKQCAEGGPAPCLPLRVATTPANLSVARLLRDIARLPPEVLAASVCMNVSSLLLPLVVMQVYDRVIPNQSGSTLLALASLAILVFVIEAVLRSARAHVVFWSATRTAWLRQDDAVARVLAAPGGWWAKESPSRVVDRLRSVAAVSEW